MRVLIVDDDMAVTESLSRFVNWKKLGITEVETAQDAQQARKILKEKETDIIISDIEMPKESGLELLKWYREEHMYGKFLLLTSHENFYYAKEAVKLHAEEYLMKPFHVDMVEMVLQKIIQSLKQEREIRGSGAYGKWMINNVNELKLNFWYNLLSGRISHTEDNIERELEKRGMGDALIEAAQIDGAGEMKTFYKIMVPLARPVIATVSLFTGLCYWNDWTNGLYYVDNEKLYSIQLLLLKIMNNIQGLKANSNVAMLGTGSVELPSTSVRMAMAFIGILPILIIYPFVQKHLVRGVVIGAVKG